MAQCKVPARPLTRLPTNSPHWPYLCLTDLHRPLPPTSTLASQLAGSDERGLLTAQSQHEVSAFLEVGWSGCLARGEPNKSDLMLCAPSDGVVAALALRAGVRTETLGTVLQHGQSDSSGWPGPLGTRPLAGASRLPSRRFPG